MEWSVRSDGWPTLVDGSAADWWAAQAERQRARGVVIESAQARRSQLGMQLTAIGATVATAGAVSVVGAPIGLAAGLVLAGVGTLLRSRIGGLGAANDLDRDGLEDSITASTLTGHVQRIVDQETTRAILNPAGPIAGNLPWPGVRPVLERVVQRAGFDATVLWLTTATGQTPPEKVWYNGQSAPVRVEVPRIWATPAASIRVERPR